jgi:hypothetical protein
MPRDSLAGLIEPTFRIKCGMNNPIRVKVENRIGWSRAGLLKNFSDLRECVHDIGSFQMPDIRWSLSLETISAIIALARYDFISANLPIRQLMAKNRLSRQVRDSNWDSNSSKNHSGHQE